ncbi:MAG: cytochrome c [Bacteroidota bacterium]
MRKLMILAAVFGACFIYACGGGDNNAADSSQQSKDESSTSSGEANPDYDPERGTGKFTHVEVPDKLDPAMAAAGEKVYSVKCAACHKLTAEKLVGPGWQDVTKRHKPEWIMNFVTNPDEMIDKDPKAQAMLEICMVRMPNQNISDDEARNLYEFMRSNDGVK